MLAAVDGRLREAGAIETAERGLRIDRRIVSAAEIGHYRRDDHTDGCVVAVVSCIGRSGSVTVIGINVRWDDGRVYVPRMPGIDA